jgi:protein-tyrosine phosphatase
MPPKILFICTGNYYRSRFAEELFNALASRLSLSWQAVSRGLDTQQGANIGPISPYVLKKLKTLDIPVKANLREPLQLGETDLVEADLVIALDAEEHKPLMARQFAEWADRTMYWHVPDLHMMKAEDALSRIESNVSLLVQELSRRIRLSEQGKFD